MLRLDRLQAWYGATQALFDVSLDLAEGTTLALVGTNGAGKTTTIRAVTGLVRTAGTVTFDGRDISRLPAHRRVRQCRLAVVHEGRGLFNRLTVRENLVVGRPGARAALDDVLDLFPALRGRLKQNVSELSGGQQQMVAIGRAMVQQPRLLLLDEPSLGLAPVIVDEIYDHLLALRETGITILLVEQSVARARAFADRLCLMRIGTSAPPVDARDGTAVDALVSTAFGAPSAADPTTTPQKGTP
jgi:ABC-type branched-subunit amino acid transport system ATPase component